VIICVFLRSFDNITNQLRLVRKHRYRQSNAVNALRPMIECPLFFSENKAVEIEE